MPNYKNYMEVIVEEMLDSVMKKTASCTCQNCRDDIAAITLNSLPAKYYVTHEGSLYSKLNNLRQQFEVDVISHIAQAAEMVARRPRHPEAKQEQ